MNRIIRIQLAIGILLILLGAWFLADRNIPEFHEFFVRFSGLPFSLAGIGGLLLLLGILLGVPGMAVPASIVAGVGAILYYQKTVDDYSSWSYMWSLIPGFMGIGSWITALLGENSAFNLKRGLNLLVFSAVLFLVFSTIFGGLDFLGNIFPAILIILLGIWMIARSVYKKATPGDEILNRNIKP